VTPTKLTKQMLDFQKTTFDNAFNAAILLQDQAEKMASSFLDKTIGFPAEARNAIDEWVKAYKKGREDYKKMIFDGFENMGMFFAEPEKEIKKPEKKELAKSQ
jgi:hypothetical protein